MEDNPNINNQSVSPVQPVAQPNGQMPNEFIPPAQPMQFVSQPENGGVSPKKNKKMLVLVVCLLVAAIIAAAIVVFLLVFKKEEPTSEPEEGTETSSEDAKTAKDDTWSCYYVGNLLRTEDSGFEIGSWWWFMESIGSIRIGGELSKHFEFKISQDNIFEFKTKDMEVGKGKWDFRPDSKIIDDSLERKPSVKLKDEKVFFYGLVDDATTLERYQAYMYPDAHSDDETIDGELYNLELGIWFEPGEDSGAFVTRVNSNAKDFSNGSLPIYYCLNDSSLVGEFGDGGSVDEEYIQQMDNTEEAKDIILIDHVNYIASSIASYQSNNNGKVPSGEKRWKVFFEEYIGSVDGYDLKECGYYADSGDSVDCADPSGLSWKSDGNEIYVAFGATCNSERNGIVLGNAPRSYAIYSILSDNSVHCLDNS